MRLVDYTDDDLAFSVALETDPEVMAHLGGPRPLADIERVHPKRVVTDPARGMWLKVLTDAGDEAGQIGVWRAEHGGEEVWEVGWMLHTSFHGRGLGSAALGELIERMRDAGIYDVVHAYPGADNGPSNGLCRKFGFELVGEIDEEFRGVRFVGNHWVLRL